MRDLKEKGLASLQGLVFIGSSTWARTRDLRINSTSEGERAPSPSEALTVSLPLNFPKRCLERRFKPLLAEAHKGKRGVQLARTGKAKYTFKGQPNIPALEQGLMVYDALKETEGIKPKTPQWQIAQDLQIVEKEMRINKDDTVRVAAGNKNVLTAIVGRYKKELQRRLKRPLWASSRQINRI
jgi:hypothetical protein